MIKMIVALNSQGVIGKDNKIPWFYKGDLKFFKEQTSGHVVIMGRKTWESLPPKMRPLPNRVNIVVSSKSPMEIGMENISPTCMMAHDMNDALKAAAEFGAGKDIWLIGGASIYEEGMKIANEMLISHVPDELPNTDGCVLFPKFTDDWGLAATGVHPECPELFVAQWVRS